MTRTVKIGSLFVGVLLIAAMGFCTIWTIINWGRVQDMMSGTGIYNKMDLNNAYKDGYDTALQNKADYAIIIDQLRSDKTALQGLVAEQENQVAALKQSNTTNTAALTQAQEEITRLTNQVAALESNLAYYENVLAGFVDADQVMATFYVDGTIYDFKLVTNGDTVQVPDPISSYWAFEGWLLNDELVDLTTLPLTENCVFYAKLDYVTYTVSFMFGDEPYGEPQAVRPYGHAVAPDLPDDENIIFHGWSLDGQNLVDVSTLVITQDTCIVAIFGQWVELGPLYYAGSSLGYCLAEDSPYLGRNLSGYQHKLTGTCTITGYTIKVQGQDLVTVPTTSTYDLAEIRENFGAYYVTGDFIGAYNRIRLILNFTSNASVYFLESNNNGLPAYAQSQFGRADVHVWVLIDDYTGGENENN